MAISFASISTTVNSTKTLGAAVTVPAGAVGDLMLCCAVNAAVKPYNALTNWTPIEPIASTTTSTTALGWWYRYATGTDTNPTPAWSTTTNACVAAIVRYSGVLSTAMTSIAANRHGYVLGTTVSTTSVQPPALAGATSVDLIVDIWAFGESIRTGGTNSASAVAGLPSLSGAPAGWTQRGVMGTGVGGTGPTNASGATSWNVGLVIADRLGAVDRPTVSSTSNPTDEGSKWIAASLALSATSPPSLVAPGQFFNVMHHHQPEPAERPREVIHLPHRRGRTIMRAA